MAELPKVEPQSTGHVLRDLKAAVVAAKKELDASKTVLQSLSELLKQNTFYESEIDGARGRIFMLLVAQIRHAEVAHADEYIAHLDEGLAILTQEVKKADPV